MGYGWVRVVAQVVIAVQLGEPNVNAVVDSGAAGIEVVLYLPYPFEDFM